MPKYSKEITYPSALSSTKKLAIEFMQKAASNKNGKFWLPTNKETGDEIDYGELKIWTHKLVDEALGKWFNDQTPSCQKTIVRQTAQIFLRKSHEANEFRTNNEICNIYVAISDSWRGWNGEPGSPYILFQKEGADLDFLIERGTLLLDPNDNQDWTTQQSSQSSMCRPTNNFHNCYSSDDSSVDGSSIDGSHMTPIDVQPVQQPVLQPVQQPDDRSHSCSGGSYASPVQDTLLAEQLNQSSAFKVLAEISALTDIDEVDRVRNQIFAFINTIGSNLGYPSAPYAPYAIQLQGNHSETDTVVEP